jgi:hypothetical protein
LGLNLQSTIDIALAGERDDDVLQDIRLVPGNGLAARRLGDEWSSAICSREVTVR